MKAFPTTGIRAASVTCIFVALACVLFLSGCATDTWATKSPEDGTEYPGWAKAMSLPLSPFQHETTY